MRNDDPFMNMPRNRFAVSIGADLLLDDPESHILEPADTDELAGQILRSLTGLADANQTPVIAWLAARRAEYEFDSVMDVRALQAVPGRWNREVEL